MICYTCHISGKIIMLFKNGNYYQINCRYIEGSISKISYARYLCTSYKIDVKKAFLKCILTEIDVNLKKKQFNSF